MKAKQKASVELRIYTTAAKILLKCYSLKNLPEQFDRVLSDMLLAARKIKDCAMSEFENVSKS